MYIYMPWNVHGIPPFWTEYVYIYIHVYSRTEMPIYSENLRIPCFHMFSSYSRPGLRYITFIGISAKFECKSWVMENPMPHECEFLRVVKTKNKKTTGVGLALGLELLVVALKVLKDISPYSVFIPATHTQKSSHRTKSSHSTDVIALHSGWVHILRNHRTPRNHRILGNGTYFIFFRKLAKSSYSYFLS